MGEIFELEVAAGMDPGGNLLVIEAQGIAHLMEQASGRVGRDGEAQCR
jgi:hypothetical protein